jgi:hypothetical protein
MWYQALGIRIGHYCHQGNGQEIIEHAFPTINCANISGFNLPVATGKIADKPWAVYTIGLLIVVALF